MKLVSKNGNYAALIEIMENPRTLQFLTHHLVTEDSARLLMLLMKIYIELGPLAPQDKIAAIDNVLRCSASRRQLHSLFTLWSMQTWPEPPFSHSQLCLDE